MTGQISSVVMVVGLTLLFLGVWTLACIIIGTAIVGFVLQAIGDWYASRD